MPKDTPNMLEHPTRPSKVRKLIKLLSTVLLVGIFVSILAKGTIYGAFKEIFPLSPFFGHQLCTPVTESDEFRLVSVHRAGIGKARNQVYQVLNISCESHHHGQSATDGKY